MKWKLTWGMLTVFWVLMAIRSASLTINAEIPMVDKTRTFLWILATMVWIAIAWSGLSLRGEE